MGMGAPLSFSRDAVIEKQQGENHKGDNNGGEKPFHLRKAKLVIH